MSGNAWADHLTHTIATLLCAGALSPCGIRSNGKLPMPRCDRETFRAACLTLSPEPPLSHSDCHYAASFPIESKIVTICMASLIGKHTNNISKSPTRGSEELVEEGGQCESPFLQPSPKTTAQLTLVRFYLQVFMRRRGLRGLHPHSLDLMRASPIKEHRQKQVLRKERAQGFLHGREHKF